MAKASSLSPPLRCGKNKNMKAGAIGGQGLQQTAVSKRAREGSPSTTLRIACTHDRPLACPLRTETYPHPSNPWQQGPRSAFFAGRCQRHARRARSSHWLKACPRVKADPPAGVVAVESTGMRRSV